MTEAGTSFAGSIKSSVGMGALLVDGVGDTLRVLLTADPVEEVRFALEILKALGLRERGPFVIACPSCGRDNVGVETLAVEVEERLRTYPQHFEVAVLGCAVNGPGEAAVLVVAWLRHLCSSRTLSVSSASARQIWPLRRISMKSLSQSGLSGLHGPLPASARTPASSTRFSRAPWLPRSVAPVDQALADLRGRVLDRRQRRIVREAAEAANSTSCRNAAKRPTDLPSCRARR